ncbi:MerR family transcriptional regulator [Actinosynnema pretiosum]|uniref:MerR family transcriptional regulator n=1 Tax=Actinosynnema pretiosum TaxID=42197 RepID=A0A290Z8H9_9PSEU|nr:MerR family transcriptional regulator [Actinosynnema pretiosum]ATE55282.1 MerR family transcriptional regulator [Actinosynnema pretiosum]
MAWSTRELADLAGSTVKTVRHYHRMGLLELPGRGANGYKRYGAAHLARVLRIKRLTGFGLTLSRIREMEEVGERADDSIEAIDAELAEAIARLSSARAELAVLREHRAPLDTPAVFGPVARGLSEADRDLLAVLAGTFDDEALADLGALVAESGDDGTEEEFSRLPEDADADAVESLARRMVGPVRRAHERFPWMAAPGACDARGRGGAAAVVATAFAERFNRAQLGVLVRVNALLGQEEPAERSGP